jgi:hypothetical protein
MDPARVVDELEAGGRQLHAFGAAHQQCQPQLVLEPADLLRQRRLGDVDVLRRAPEMAVADDRGEVLELAQLHALAR